MVQSLLLASLAPLASRSLVYAHMIRPGSWYLYAGDLL